MTYNFEIGQRVRTPDGEIGRITDREQHTQLTYFRGYKVATLHSFVWHYAGDLELVSPLEELAEAAAG